MYKIPNEFTTTYYSFISEYKDDMYQKDKFFNYDLALITIDIKFPFKLSKRINPICLPDKKSELLHDDIFTIAGWGKFDDNAKTTNLRYAEVEPMDYKRCYKAIEKEDFDPETEGTETEYFKNPDGYCLLGQNRKERMCVGDTGSPAITIHNHRAYLVGLGK